MRLIRFPIRVWGERTSGTLGTVWITSDGRQWNFLESAKTMQDIKNKNSAKD
jgi:hypothetical protein